jgi:hypothetical protein
MGRSSPVSCGTVVRYSDPYSYSVDLSTCSALWGAYGTASITSPQDDPGNTRVAATRRRQLSSAVLRTCVSSVEQCIALRHRSFGRSLCLALHVSVQCCAVICTAKHTSSAKKTDQIRGKKKTIQQNRQNGPPRTSRRKYLKPVAQIKWQHGRSCKSFIFFLYASRPAES